MAKILLKYDYRRRSQSWVRRRKGSTISQRIYFGILRIYDWKYNPQLTADQRAGSGVISRRRDRSTRSVAKGTDSILASQNMITVSHLSPINCIGTLICLDHVQECARSQRAHSLDILHVSEPTFCVRVDLFPTWHRALFEIFWKLFGRTGFVWENMCYTFLDNFLQNTLEN